MRLSLSSLVQTLGVLGLLAAVTGVAGGVLPTARAESVVSRLNSQLRKQQELFLPDRLLLGHEARFVMRAQPGAQVTLYLSPTNEGVVVGEGSQGVRLRVGADFTTLTGVTPANGVLVLSTTLPGDQELVGKTLYVDALSCDTNQPATCQSLVVKEASGRMAASNGLEMRSPETRTTGGATPMVLPMMPGMDARTVQAMQQLGRTMNAKTDEERARLDDGRIDRNRLYDRNPLVTRPGVIQSTP